MDHAIPLISDYLPAEVSFGPMLQFIALVAIVILGLGFVLKLLLGFDSEWEHGLSSAVGILFIYAATILIMTFRPLSLERYLSPLPFVAFSEEYMLIMPIAAAEFSDVCGQILSMVVLAFLVNLLDTLLPEGEGALSWFLWRALSVTASMFLHYLASSAISALIPGVLAAYAQTILLVILLILVFMGLIRHLVGLVFGIVDPVLGIISSFFSSLIGRQLSKAVLTTALLCGVVYLLEWVGYTVICVSAAALPAYIPLIAALLILWYIIGQIF